MASLWRGITASICSLAVASALVMVGGLAARADDTATVAWSGIVSLGTLGDHLSGEPVRVQAFSLGATGGTFEPTVSTTAAADGSFSLALVSDQIYEVMFSTSTGDYQAQYFASPLNAATPSSFLAPSSASAGNNITLVPAASITGSVKLGSAMGAPGTSVAITGSWFNGTLATGAGGSFTLPHVGDGSWTATFRYGSGDGLYQDLDNVPISVVGGVATPNPLNVVLLHTDSLTGLVSFGDGAAPGGAKIAVQAMNSSGGSPLSTTTDATGHYTIPHLPDGSYTLSFTDPGGRYATTYGPGTRASLPATTPVFVGGGTTVTVDETMPVGGTASGVIGSVVPVPMQSLNVTAVDQDDPTIGNGCGTDSNSQFAYTAVLADGHWIVRNLFPGHYVFNYGDFDDSCARDQSYGSGPTAPATVVTISAGTTVEVDTPTIPARYEVNLAFATPSSPCIAAPLLTGWYRATANVAWTSTYPAQYENDTVSGVHIANLYAGSYHFVATCTAGDGVVQAGDTGPIQIGQAPATSGTLTMSPVVPGVPLPSGSPIGNLDRPHVSLGTSPATFSTISFTGWSIDPDTTQPVYVDVSLDGGSAVEVLAGSARSDVSFAYPGYGPDHGFAGQMTQPLALGRHLLCATARNVGPAAPASRLACASFQVVASAGGALQVRWPSPVASDYSGDGFQDVLAVNPAGGLINYVENGSGGWLSTWPIGSGWNSMTAVLRISDFDGDGRADLLARNSSGQLILYRGNGADGWLGASVVGSGWNGMTSIFDAGDFDGTGHDVIMARDASGNLWAYPTTGFDSWGTPRLLGTGWGAFTSLFSAGNFDSPTQVSIFARNASGQLLDYEGDGLGGWQTGRPVVVGTGWGAFTNVYSPGDFDGDGYSDVLATDSAGRLILYSGNGAAGWTTGVGHQVGTGWSVMRIVS